MRKPRLAALAAALLGIALTASAAVPHVDHVVIRGTINPASSDFLQKAIAQAEQEGADALVVELDTPGGLVTATKDIIQAILNARVPVIVYVSPRGAWAGSAGTFITLAAHVAAMAPGTSIGAAHPVGVGGGGPRPGGEEGEEGKGSRDFAAEKAENLLSAYIESIARERERNVEWAVKAVRESVAVPADEALELKVIDLVAEDLDDLLAQIDGRTVKVAGEERTLQVAGAQLHEIEMPWVTRIMHVIASPDVAVLLLMAGLLGLYIEFNQPGLVVPGLVGGVCLILALIALQLLPFSWLGLLILLGGIGLIVAEAFFTSYGVLFALGAILMLVGGSMMFSLPEVGDLTVSFWTVLVPAVAAMALAMGVVIYAVGRSLRSRPVAGVHELVGMIGRADTNLDPEGMVFVRGELWKARAEEPVAAGERVEVVAVEGLRLRVRRAPPER